MDLQILLFTTTPYSKGQIRANYLNQQEHFPLDSFVKKAKALEMYFGCWEKVWGFKKKSSRFKRFLNWHSPNKKGA
jgi:hypothetical protein